TSNLLMPAATVQPDAAPPPAPITTETERKPTGVPKPTLQPPSPSGKGAVQDDEREVAPGATPVEDSTDAMMLERVSDACFADSSWATLSDNAAPATNGMGGLALALVLAGWSASRPTDAESRKRHNFLSPGK